METSDVEGEDLAAALGEGIGHLSDQRLQFVVVLLGDHLFRRIGIARGGRLLQNPFDRIDCDLPRATFVLFVQQAVGGGANPRVDLAGLGDLRRRLDKPLAGALDRVLDLLGGEARMALSQFGSERAASLATDEITKKVPGMAVEVGGRLGESRVHHPNRGIGSESAPPFGRNFHRNCDLR